MSDSDDTPQGVPHPRGIRSYVLRTGRTTTGQAKALQELGPQYLLPFQPQPLDLAQAFGREAPTILEIGFGMGEATAHIAALMPERNFLCCEVHDPGVGALLMRIAERGLANVRIVKHDAVEVIENMLAPASLAQRSRPWSMLQLSRSARATRRARSSRGIGTSRRRSCNCANSVRISRAMVPPRPPSG